MSSISDADTASRLLASRSASALHHTQHRRPHHNPLDSTERGGAGKEGGREGGQSGGSIRLSVSEASLRDAALRRKQKELEAKEKMVGR